MAQQLRMSRPNLEGLGEVVLPHGYSIRTYKEGDEEAWVEIVNNSLSSKWDVERCRRELTGCPQFKPKGLFFATYAGKSVGTTCAWTKSPREKKVGNVHMVGVLPEHRGKRLGYALCLNVLEFFKENGFQCARLSTNDFRLPAIKTYLNLGFEPDYINKTHRMRWNAIFARLASRDQWSSTEHK